MWCPIPCEGHSACCTLKCTTTSEPVLHVTARYSPDTLQAHALGTCTAPHRIAGGKSIVEGKYRASKGHTEQAWAGENEVGRGGLGSDTVLGGRVTLAIGVSAGTLVLNRRACPWDTTYHMHSLSHSGVQGGSAHCSDWKTLMTSHSAALPD